MKLASARTLLGLGQCVFQSSGGPGSHFGNGAYASAGDAVSVSTPAPWRRRFPWAKLDAVWPTNDVWHAIEERVVAHAFALVVGDLLDKKHLGLLFDEALTLD